MDYIGFNGSATSFNLLADLRFKDADGSHYVGFQAPSAVGVNLVWTLPASDGSANRVLKTDGSGNLNFAEITNAYIASSAAIAGTKISPDFGSQNIITTGTASTGALGVTGNITVSGTVDGVDIAARDTLFGGLTSSSGVLTDGVIATTQTASDNTTKVATTAYVTTAVNNLINGAPAALDTLNELAAAMNDDAAFSTTVTNSLATKLALAGGQMTGNITFSGSQTVDGRDLSVDGAKLDGGIMLADGDKGDITVSNTGATFTIDSGVVTSAKIASATIATSNIADDAITTAKLAADAVTAAELSNNIVDDNKLTSNAVTTVKIADSAVTSAKIADGTIVNADINASAAIAGTKISPDFGSQNIVTTGQATFGALSTGFGINVTGSSPYINFTASFYSPNYLIKNNQGTLEIFANSSSPVQLINATSTTLVSKINHDFESGIDVTGNITVTGTVDGVDIATRDTLFGGLTASSGVLTNGVTATTQSASDNSTKVATTAYADAAISNATITGSQISTNAISTNKIADDAVTSAKIADDAVTSAKIADDAVGADQLASNSVVSASIVDGAIVNADINASAAIAGTKIDPDFGAQNISTNGSLNINSISTGGSITILNTTPQLNFNDTSDNPDYQINIDSGTFNIRDTTNSINRLVINSDGHIDIDGNVDFSAGIDVTGNITATGTLGCGDITSGAIGCGDITITDVSPAINFTDSDGSQNYQIRLNSGILKFKDTTNGAERIQINADGHVDVLGNLDVGSGLDVTGAITATGNLTITNSFPKIDLVKDSTSFQINNENGVFNIRQNGTTNKIQINTDGHVDITAHLDAEGGVDVTGNISVTGTVDGVDIATRDTLFGGLTSSSGVLTNGVTATTQSASDNSTKVATTAYVDSATSSIGTTINNNADNRVITGSDTSNTLEGESNLTFNGTTLAVTGFISCTQNLSVSGQANISGNLNTLGNIDLGNSSTDTISFGGRVDTDIIPLDDSDEDLGSSSLRWQNIYGDNLYSALVEVEGGILNVKNTGSQSVVRFYCESSNAHYAEVQAPAHSVFSGNVTLTLPAAAGNQSLVGTTETQTLTNKTLTSAVLNTGVSGSAILDEDNMASNSATQLATQQSIKAYVDANSGGGGGSPGGSNTQVQFNNSGSFGGSSNLTFDGTNLTVGGTVSGTSSASGTAGFRKITASTSAPSGGSDGDVWIKYTA